MNPDRFLRLKDLAFEVVDLSEEERRTYLDEACRGDPELRREVEELLVHDRQTGQEMNSDALLAHAFESISPPTRLVGQTVSHYQILALLGEGGMGQVFRARDTRLGRDVALKVISPALASDPDRIKRFEQEAHAAGALNHPNIVAIHDVGVHEGSPFVVMELLEGETLWRRLREGPLPVRKACDVAAQAARGLAAAHEKGIVHRDIKPENLFITKDGRVKILDFGVAKLTRGNDIVPSGDKEAAHSLTGSGMIIGTSGYLSPEQARGEPADHRSDLFALGVLLYEMLTGKRAFHRTSFVETLHAVLQEEPPPLSASRPEVPSGLEAIVRRCLEKQPGERFQSGVDLAFALETLSGSAVRSAGTTAPRPHLLRWIAIYGAAALALVLVMRVADRLTEDPTKVDLGKYRLTPFASSLARHAFSSWSPDGKAIAFLGRKDDSILSKLQIWIQRDGAVTPVPLTKPPFEPDWWCSWWSPDARMIYTPGSIAGKRGVYRIPTGGGEPVLVQAGDYSAVALSPDGRTLAWLAQDSSDVCSLWYASPPDAPPRRYGPAPSVIGSLGQAWAGFAPDGSKLLLSFRTPTVGQQCWMFPWPPARGSRVLPSLSGMWPFFSWMPDSRHVVFSMQEDPAQPGRIYLGDTRSGRFWPALLGQGTGATAPSVAPDGRRIAFTTVTVTRDVIEVPIEDGAPRTILGGPRSYDQPALSADGKELVYTSDVRGPEEVWLRDLTSGLDRLLATPGDFPGADMFEGPVLSRDGRRFAVSVGRFTDTRSTWQLYVGLVGGGVPVPATMEEVEGGATWSPDGTALAYLRRGLPLRPTSLARIRPGGSEPPIQLLKQCSLDVDPEWSPTGEWIAAGDSTGTRVVLVSPDGQMKRDLPARAGWRPTDLGWSPDGRVLYVVEFSDGLESNHCELASIDMETGRREQVRDLGPLVPESSWMGGGAPISVTPDGRSLVYSIGHERSEIWTLEGLQMPKPWYARLLP